jgi:hypothetical protein
MPFGKMLPLAYFCDGFVVDAENIEIKPADEPAHQYRFIARLLVNFVVCQKAFLQLFALTWAG